MNKLLSLALASMVTVGAAQATTISFDASYGPARTDWDPQTLSLQRFDPVLGTLNSVTFQFSGTIRSDFKTKNKGDSATTALSLLEGSLRFVLPTATETLLTMSGSQATPLAAKSEATYSLTDSDSGMLMLDNDLGAFIGVGSFGLDVFALASSKATGSGNVQGRVLSYATASATVTYDYTTLPQRSNPVPEPASLALVGLALAAAGLSRRRA